MTNLNAIGLTELNQNEMNEMDGGWPILGSASSFWSKFWRAGLGLGAGYALHEILA